LAEKPQSSSSAEVLAKDLNSHSMDASYGWGANSR
jgi:hypothetical protein